MGSYVSVNSGELVQINSTPTNSHSRKVALLGCDNCTLNKKGIHKVFGLKRIKGRKIFVWAQAPGKTENEEGRELVGRAGGFLWEELEAVGIERDMCDIQNVVRCWPTIKDTVTGALKDRTPTKDEAKCCSIYTEQALALNKGKAKIHLIFGQFAAATLLGREYKKSRPIFWSEKFQAKVIVLDHPSYFLRGAPQHRLILFRARLKAAAKALKSGGGKFDFLKQYNYKLITDPVKAARIIKRAMHQPERVSVDIEDGIIDPDTGKPSYEGKRVILTLGICWKPGEAYTFPLDHPEVYGNRRRRRKVIRWLAKLLRSKRVKKTLHHGSHDEKRIRELLGIKLRGYDFDTNYSCYFKWPAQKKYGLEKIAEERVMEFAGYKDIIKPHLDPERPNFSTIPLKVMKLYNCGDADLGKRAELLTQKMQGPLLRTYVKAAVIIDKMQNIGPYLDLKYFEEVEPIIKRRLKRVTNRLMAIGGDPDLNLNAPQQCAKIIYDKLKLPVPTDKQGNEVRTTSADTLKLLSAEKRGEFPKLLVEHRELTRMKGTYLDNYKHSAELYEGQLRTLWWLTGTVTGRLRSGGKDEGVDGIVNMQNLHGELLLKLLLISDPKWRKALRAGPDCMKEEWRRIKRLQAFLAFDYAQIEIRVLAHMSQDPVLIQAVESGDIHSMVGHELTGRSVEEIKNDDKVRTMIKSLHFGIVYGLKKASLHKKLLVEGVKVSRAETDELYDKYFRRYRIVKQLIEYLQEFAEKHGYVESIFGFRAPINTHAQSEDGGSSGGPFWGNQAVNYPIQGGAHQIMLCGMALLAMHPERYPKLDTPVMEIHDSLVCYNQTDEIEDAYPQGKQLLEKDIPRYIEDNFGFKLRIPIAADCKVGYRWGGLAKYSGQTTKEWVCSWKETNKAVKAKVSEKWMKLAA